MTDRPKDCPLAEVGPTGEHPQGKMAEDDKGGLNAGLIIKDGNIIILFNTEITWLGMSPEEAEEFAKALIEKAKEARGEESPEGELKTYSIWAEGYRATGESGGASHVGSAQGKTFKKACDNLALTDKPFAAYYDSEAVTYWGCKLFDNETDARVSFG